MLLHRTLTVGINTLEPLNLTSLPRSDLCCSKKQKRGIEIVFTVRVKSCRRSANISESFSKILSRLLCSPCERAEAMEAMTAALDCVFDPLCGVPKNNIPATYLMIQG